MANANWTPDNQANTVIDANNEPTEKKVESPVEWQRETIKWAVLRWLLALQMAVWWSWVAHAWWLSPKELAEQDKPGISKVIDTSKQKDSLKNEVQDKITEKEILDIFATKKTVWKIAENRYLNLSSAWKEEVFKFYTIFKNNPKIFKLLSNCVTVIWNIDESSDFIKDFDINNNKDIPSDILDELIIMIDTDSSVKDFFVNNSKKSLYNYGNILVLDETLKLLRIAIEKKAEQKLVWAEQKLKNTQEIGKELDDLLDYFRKLNWKS